MVYDKSLAVHSSIYLFRNNDGSEAVSLCHHFSLVSTCLDDDLLINNSSTGIVIFAATGPAVTRLVFAGYRTKLWVLHRHK